MNRIPNHPATIGFESVSIYLTHSYIVHEQHTAGVYEGYRVYKFQALPKALKLRS